MGRPRKYPIEGENDYGDANDAVDSVDAVQVEPTDSVMTEPTDSARVEAVPTVEAERMPMDGLTAEQRDLLVTDALKRIIADGEKKDLQSGTIPALVRLELSKADVQYMLIDMDVRIFEIAWDYYRKNVPDASFMTFLDRIDRIKQHTVTKRIYSRVGYLNIAC